MRGAAKIALIFIMGCSLWLQSGQTAYAQANEESQVKDTTLNDLVIQGDSSSLAPAEETVEVEGNDSLENGLKHPDDVFKGSEAILLDRLKKIENKIPMTLNARTKSFMHYFTVRNRRYALVMERRRRLFFPIFEQVFKQMNLPDELKYLAIVESGLNPRAMSRVGAAGLWQFMPGTGREFGLYQDQYIDERLDPYLATIAAGKYLKQLYNTFDDWELGISSYNCGPGNVRRAIRRSGYKNSFWGVYNNLPAETRGYLPQLVALTYSMNYLESHDIIADSIEYPVVFDTITIRQYLNLEVFSKELNIPVEDFMKMNPAFLKNYFPGHRPVTIRIPADKMVYYAQNEYDILDAAGKRDVAVKEVPVIVKSYSQKATQTKTVSSSQKKKIIYIVKRGDVLGSIADKHNVGLSELKSWNGLRKNSIRQGQKLIIYKKGTVAKTSSSQSTTAASGKKTPTFHYVKQGDTLWTISKKYDLSIDKIKKLNNLKDGNIKPGQKIKLS
ncbi:LysM peptidoglycan-binding domain-containing protein [Candidatus Parcubacteria bacterium]|nr:LysM peptidoglycan-binding domain-containing protein [Candidatus Parcubacteria bacterium]